MKETSIKTYIHIEQIFRNKMLNPNPYHLTEEEFNKAKEIATNLMSDLHKVAGHSLGLAASAVLFSYEALLAELTKNKEPNNEKAKT
jgi:hypothetical protein